MAGIGVEVGMVRATGVASREVAVPAGVVRVAAQAVVLRVVSGEVSMAATEVGLMGVRALKVEVTAEEEAMVVAKAHAAGERELAAEGREEPKMMLLVRVVMEMATAVGYRAVLARGLAWSAAARVCAAEGGMVEETARLIEPWCNYHHQS